MSGLSKELRALQTDTQTGATENTPYSPLVKMNV